MLSVQNVDVFINQKEIIHQASFQVPTGAVIGLVGPNGAGKTTIMKTILGLTKFSGSIQIDNQEVTENNHQALQQVGALIEHPAIYPFLTGLQNLELYSQDHQDLQEVVSLVQMESYLNQRTKNYSLGMKQKLGIALALLNKPRLVILDEPMNGLDIEATITIRKVIKQYAQQGTAFLISSHVLSELQKVMTGIVLLNAGQVIMDKTVKEFTQEPQQQYQVLTDNQSQAQELLQKKQIKFSSSGPYLLISHADILSAQTVFYTHNLHLLELAPVKANLEELIVDLLQQQRKMHV
ncbi:ATP-binding cassette domain-containing protein [Lactobacillus sp. W8089]|nr:ATP-binding cassette domain-containing protein [Lactobacillus sp. W8086]MBI0108996.1 ATP-binding cassette domain-containing protein [Lactobacillus sp. W8085]MBI0112212.1 ATP-binding cassette domain-containing protein [Lactobacillus sp. W8088]MBI0115928.1 ATP-binding cassette domain-containing protein [Lactobacillus sp. W8087]MBI0119653.1 ATP-binding cassette domain-containing protein [Lactobacillus sp. W8089]MBI0131618.1 ATP-binding cassette domain-containing protein [Lactobacillus sp. W809